MLPRYSEFVAKLARRRSGFEKIKLLKIAIAISPSTPSLHVALAEAYLGVGAIGDAALQFRRAIVLSREPGATLRIALASCYEALDKPANAVCEYKSALRADPASYLAFSHLQKAAYTLFNKGDYEAAASLYRETNALTANPRSREFFSDYRQPGIHTVESFRRLLEEKWRVFDAGDMVLPQAYREHKKDSDAPSLVDRFRAEKRRVLVVSSEFIGHSDQYIKHDLTIAYVESLQACKIRHAVFHADTFHRSPPEIFQTAVRLWNKIDEFRPDLVLFDANLNLPHYERHGIGFPLNKHFINEARRVFHCQFVGVASDAYGKIGGEITAYWTGHLDAIVTFEPSQREVNDNLKRLVAAVPVPKIYFSPSAAGKARHPICFVGTTFRYMRADSLALLKCAGIPIHFQGGDRKKGAPEIDEYASLLRDAKIVLNFSAREQDLPYNSYLDCITGRVYETLNAGALLLEQSNASTEKFFVPYVHYVPFRTIGELEFLCKFFLANEDARAEIARRGHDFAREYSDEMFWGRILKHAARQSVGNGVRAH